MEGRKLVLPLCCIVGLVASRAPGEDLQGTYDAIFGDQEKKVLRLYELQYSRGRRSERREAGKVLLGHLVAVADTKMAEDRADNVVAIYETGCQYG